MNATHQHGTPHVLSVYEHGTWNVWHQHKMSCERCHNVNDLLCMIGLMLWDEWMLASGATKRQGH